MTKMRKMKNNEQWRLKRSKNGGKKKKKYTKVNKIMNVHLSGKGGNNVKNSGKNN
jgi:hypothetical protein